MYRSFFIAKNNMKKQKADMITFFILTLISALLIFDCASAILGLSNVLDKRFDACNGAHVMLCSPGTQAETDAAEQAFTKNSHIVSYEKTPLIRFTAEYKNKKSEDYLEFMFLAERFNQEKSIMTVQDPVEHFEKNDILLPLNQKSNFAIGDTLQIRFDKDVYEFRVIGYLEDPYFCSTVNITLYSVCMSGEMIDTLSEKETDYVQKRYMHKGRMAADDTFSSEDLETEIGTSYKDCLRTYAAQNTEVNMTDYMLVSWEMMRGGSQFIPMIIMAIMLVFALLILGIAIIIISFSIKDFIRKNMKNTGILEAEGYTVRELRASLILQISFVATLGAAVGIAVAVLSFHYFGDIVSFMLGLSWNQPVNYAAAAATLLFLSFVAALVALSDSAAYKRISVLDALRGGISTHNFRKNFFSFEKTPLPIPFVLSLKDFAGGVGRNILMIVISMILVISSLIGFGLVDNFGKDPDGLMKLMAFEMSDASVTVNRSGDIAEDLRALPGVKSVLVHMGFEPVVKHGKEERTVYTFAVDDMQNTQNTNMIEGRMPEKDNEVLVTMGVAKDLSIKTGDVITLAYMGSESDFLVTGINQRVERMGRSIYMLIDGANKLIPGDLSRMYTYGIITETGTDFETLSKQLEQLKEEKDLSFKTQNSRLFMESTLNGISQSMSLVCYAILLITILIVVFVESLVIRAKISREWKSMGISKAIGQTTGGLLCQIMLSNIPAVTIGALLGALLSGMAGNKMVKTAFSLFVIKNVHFVITPSRMLICFVGIIITAITAAAAAGLKVKLLNPVEMITEE